MKKLKITTLALVIALTTVASKAEFNKDFEFFEAVKHGQYSEAREDFQPEYRIVEIKDGKIKTERTNKND